MMQNFYKNLLQHNTFNVVKIMMNNDSKYKELIKMDK